MKVIETWKRCNLAVAVTVGAGTYDFCDGAKLKMSRYENGDVKLECRRSGSVIFTSMYNVSWWVPEESKGRGGHVKPTTAQPEQLRKANLDGGGQKPTRK